MGGWGSGSYIRCGSRRKVEKSLPLDIRKLHGQGLFSHGGIITSQWSIGGKVYSSLQCRVMENHLLLFYSYNGLEKEQSIDFDWTNCNYGGKRVWFKCPEC